MHLVRKGFIDELTLILENEEEARRDSLWWYGYAHGLHQAGYLTEKEHDDISNRIAEMFTAKEVDERPNYDKLPEHIREGARRYIEDGILPGSFLRAVIRNDLRKSIPKADNINITRMLDIVHFFNSEAPTACWGSLEKMDNWVEQKRRDNRNAF